MDSIKAVILDMDGTMIDTEKLYLIHWIKAANYYGYDMKPEHVFSIRSLAAKYASVKFKEFFGEDCDYLKIREKTKEFMKIYTEENGIEKKYGLDEFLEYAKNKGLKIAVATASDYERTDQILKSLNIIQYFDEIVCSNMVANGKPEPDIYIEATKRLGYNPEACLAVEDSPNGVLSAYRAGCKVIMIPDLTEPDEETMKYLYGKSKNLLEAEKYL